jgi:hypothetical protein
MFQSYGIIEKLTSILEKGYRTVSFYHWYLLNLIKHLDNREQVDNQNKLLDFHINQLIYHWIIKCPLELEQ